jgi:uroporphyrinogen-III synthase
MRNITLELFVAKLIEKSRADGQLDESDLTFKDLGVISESFCRTLRALRHERVMYPTSPTATTVGAAVELSEGGSSDEDQLQSQRSQSTSDAQSL